MSVTPRTRLPDDGDSPSGTVTASTGMLSIGVKVTSGNVSLQLIKKNTASAVWYRVPGAVLSLSANGSEANFAEIFVENKDVGAEYHLLDNGPAGATYTAYLDAVNLASASVSFNLASPGTIGGSTPGDVHAADLTTVDDATIGDALIVTGQLSANGGAALAGSAPSAAADKVMKGVTDIAGAATAAEKTNYEGGATKVERVRAAGTLNVMHFSEDFADDNSITLPTPSTGKIGILEISVGPTEWGHFSVQNDLTVTKLGGSTNAVTTDTDTKVVCLVSGTAVLRNRSGGTLNAVGSYRWS